MTLSIIVGDVMERRRRALTEYDLKLMGLPPRYWPDDGAGNGVSFSGVSEGRHKEAARNYLRKLPEMLVQGYGMFLCGPYGTGKTALAALICHEARRIESIVYFIRAFELKDAIVHDRMWDEGVLVADRVKKVDLLVIDDLGKELS